MSFVNVGADCAAATDGTRALTVNANATAPEDFQLVTIRDSFYDLRGPHFQATKYYTHVAVVHATKCNKFFTQI
jgi:hypothetical protein